MWSYEQVQQALGGERAALFCAHYGVKPEGNCSRSSASDPHGEFAGKNVLYEVGRAWAVWVVLVPRCPVMACVRWLG